MSIFDLVTAEDIVAYWEVYEADLEGLLGEELWPSQQKLGLELRWLRGSQGLPVVLKPSAYDVASVKRDRIGFERISTEMPFFKEATYIDEQLRQELNMVLETGNQVYIDAVMNRVFDDEMRLLNGAKAQRERMKMMLLTTGTISISANGQNYDYDYGMKPSNKVSAAAPWSDADHDIITEIKEWQDAIEDETGVRPRRAVCSRKTWSYFGRNNMIRNGIWGNDSAAPVSDSRVKSYILDELDLTVVVYTKRYIDETGAAKVYIPDDMIVFFPEGALGTGWFGTTPEQSDLMAGSAANVTITDTGVAVTTVKQTDPVNVDTKVSMIFLPSYESIDFVVIADVS